MLSTPILNGSVSRVCTVPSGAVTATAIGGISSSPSSKLVTVKAAEDRIPSPAGEATGAARS